MYIYGYIVHVFVERVDASVHLFIVVVVGGKVHRWMNDCPKIKAKDLGFPL